MRKAGGRLRRAGAGLAAGLAVALACGPGHGVLAAQGQPPHVTWGASLSAVRAAPGQVVRIEVSARMDEGWYLYSLAQAPPPEPTVIAVPAGQVFALAGAIEAPVPEKRFDEALGRETELYREPVTFRVPIRSAKTTKDGDYKARVTARWQACNGRLCLRPQTATVEAPVQIRRPGAGSR